MPTAPSKPVALGSLPWDANTGPTSHKRIALTFDADMYPSMYAQRAHVSMVDLRIITLLETTHTPATVFLNGLYVKAYPDVVLRLARNPDIELANHTWDHAGWAFPCPNTTPIESPMTRRTEVTMTSALIQRLTGTTPLYFRFPGFCHTADDLRLVRSLGEVSIGSSCYFGDTFGWSAARQVASVEGGCGWGAIVVAHLDGPPYTPNAYEALLQLIPWWRAHGWTVTTVGDLLGHPTPRPAG